MWDHMCRLYAKTITFYKGLEHPWILVSTGALETIPLGWRDNCILFPIVFN